MISRIGFVLRTMNEWVGSGKVNDRNDRWGLGGYENIWVFHRGGVGRGGGQHNLSKFITFFLCDIR